MPYLKNSQKPQFLNLLEEPHPEEALDDGQLAAALCDIQPSLSLYPTGFIRLPASAFIQLCLMVGPIKYVTS